MRWPWQKRETRAAGGDYHDSIVALAEAQAAGKAADTGRTAAVEAASGLLSRSFASARVEGAEWLSTTITPRILAQIGRDLIRHGESLHVIKVGRSGMVQLRTAADWHWQDGTTDPETWKVRATCYGPSRSETWLLPQDAVVWMPWGSGSGTTYRGRSPITWASVTSRLQAEAESSLADESSGPVAQLIAIPGDGGGGGDDDPLAALKADITAARGKAQFVETVAAGWGEGMANAPRKDWVASRLGPNMPDALVSVAEKSFDRVLAACGTPPSLFTDADGTSQRESLRRYHMATVLPLARDLEAELSRKLETPVKLAFDGYPKDMVSRAQVFAKIAAHESITAHQALEIAGLLDDG